MKQYAAIKRNELLIHTIILEYHNYYAEWKEPSQKREYILYNAIYVIF